MDSTPPTPDCPKGWEYTQHPNYSDADLERTAEHALESLNGQSAADLLGICSETRPFHLAIFSGLTPDGFPYFAGHYRGEEFECLKNYNVQVSGDSRVGHRANLVLANMNSFARQIAHVMEELEALRSAKTDSPGQLLVKITNTAAAVFVYFLEIHPYANGNGHAGRYLLNAFLARFGIWLLGFPVHKRPFPDYWVLISQYRNGNVVPLVQFILSCIQPPIQAADPA